MSRDDAQEIRRLLEDRIEQVLDDLSPGWVRKGNTGYLTPKGPKELGSFTVSLRDGGKMPRGCWYRFSQAIGGGSIELVSYLRENRKDSYKEAFSWARDFLGIQRSEESPEHKREREERQARERADREARAKRDAAEAEKKKQERVLSAQDVWNETVPLAGTHGEAYLVARGIPPISEWPWNPDETLRFHPALAHERAPRLGRFPAVVGRVEDTWGEHVALKLILLDCDKPQKCGAVSDEGEDPKPTMGPAKGGAVRIGGRGEAIGVAEGMESSLAAWALENYRRPVWAALSTSGMTSFEPPTFVERVVIWADGDKAVLTPNGQILEPPGIRAARELQKRMKAIGLRCSINEGARDGDALDLLIARRKHEARTGAREKHGTETAIAAP